MAVVERARAARLLGVDIAATPEQIRDAFRRRARCVHPDAGGGDAAAMVELNAAYETLNRRAGVDWEFSVQAAVDPLEQTDDRPTDDDLRAMGGHATWLRRFGIAVALTGVVMTTIVFVVAVGYDWSLSP